MQKYLRYSLLLLLLPNWSLAQEGENLVPNPGFELLHSCPNNVAQLDKAKYWYAAMVRGSLSSELFSACVDTSAQGGVPGFFGYPCSVYGCMFPKSGNNYAGIGLLSGNTLSALEVISSGLTNELMAGEKYCITVNISIASSSTGFSNGINLLFHNDSLLIPHDVGSIVICGKRDSLLENITSLQLENKSHSDTSIWIEHKAQYVAAGGERYFTIGNLTESKDLIFDSIDTSNSFIQQYIYLDDISITHCPDPVVLPPYLKIYPNPTANRVTVATNALQADETARLELIDMLGRRVHNETLVYSSEGWELDLYGLQAGMYYLRFWVNGELRAAEKLVKSVPNSR